MTKFFVGQKVRVVECYDAEHLGKECRIVAFVQYPKGTISKTGSPLRGDVDCVVELDIGWRSTHTSKLEPILPDGAVKGDFSFHELMDNLKNGVQEHVN